MDPTQFNSLSDNADPDLLEAMEEMYALLRDGRGEELTRVTQKWPQHRSELLAYAATMRAMNNVAATSDRTNGRNSRLEPGLKNVGEFKLLREIGRGGMGVVYEAVQGSLERRVALKLLPLAALSNETQIKRFKNEARAAATLHHPNIVPVFSVGSDQGLHYYAMQLIQGPTLAQWLDELRQQSLANEASAEAETVGFELKPGQLANGSKKPGRLLTSEEHSLHGSSEWAANSAQDVETAGGQTLQAQVSTLKESSKLTYFKQVASWIEQAADALAEAHANGVLHRDIKPGNLMIDQSGKLWITDFGLARLDSDASLTATGDLLGTMRYIPPEQIRGDRALVDQRADIYSLGLTFYELLTLRPAYAGNDRSLMVQRILHDEPAKPRQLNRHIPVELETIVLKAIEKSPIDRYLTASEFAEDLKRFREDLPLKAKRPSIWKHVVKWSKRNRGVVGSFAASLVLAATVSLVVLATANWRIRKSAEELGEKNSALMLSEQKATENFEIARQAIDDMYVRFAEEWLADQEAMTATQREFLVSAANSYQQLVGNYPDDWHLKRQAIESLHNAAQVHAETHEFELEAQNYRDAIALLESVSIDNRQDVNFLIPNARIRVGRVKSESNRIQGSAPVDQTTQAVSAIADLQAYVDLHPGDLIALFTLAEEKLNFRTKDTIQSGALDAHRLVAAQDSIANRLLLVRGLMAEAESLPAGEPQLNSAEKALGIMQEVFKEAPSAINKRQLAATLYLAGSRNCMYRVIGDFVRGFELIEECVRHMEDLVNKFPGRLSYIGELADYRHQLAETYYRHLQLTGDRESGQKAIELLSSAINTALPDSDPKASMMTRIVLLGTMAKINFALGKIEVGFSNFQDATNLLKQADPAILSELNDEERTILSFLYFEAGDDYKSEFDIDVRRKLLWSALQGWEWLIESPYIVSSNSLFERPLTRLAFYYPNARVATSLMKANFALSRREVNSVQLRATLATRAAMCCGDSRMRRVLDLEDVLACATECRANEPAHISPPIAIGWYLYRKGRYQESLKYFVVDRYREEIAGAALANAKLGNDEEAEELYDRYCQRIEALRFLPWHTVVVARELNEEFGFPERTEQWLEEKWWGADSSEFLRSVGATPRQVPAVSQLTYRPQANLNASEDEASRRIIKLASAAELEILLEHPEVGFELFDEAEAIWQNLSDAAQTRMRRGPGLELSKRRLRTATDDNDLSVEQRRRLLALSFDTLAWCLNADTEIEKRFVPAKYFMHYHPDPEVAAQYFAKLIPYLQNVAELHFAGAETIGNCALTVAAAANLEFFRPHCNLSRIRGWAENALALDPDLVSAQKALGWIEYHEGNIETAVQLWMKCNADVELALGYSRLGDLQNSQNHYYAHSATRKKSVAFSNWLSIGFRNELQKYYVGELQVSEELLKDRWWLSNSDNANSYYERN